MMSKLIAMYACIVMSICTCTQTHYFTFVIRFNNQWNFVLFFGSPSSLLALREEGKMNHQSASSSEHKKFKTLQAALFLKERPPVLG